MGLFRQIALSLQNQTKETLPMKKTMLFIAAMLGGIIVTSLTACGDESTEDIPDVYRK